MRGQAMHEDGVGFSPRHEPLVDLIALEQVVAAAAVAGAPGDPGGSDDAGRPPARLIRIGAPEDFTQSSSGFFGASSGGVAIRRRKSKRLAACIHEVSTLLASPL